MTSDLHYMISPLRGGPALIRRSLRANLNTPWEHIKPALSPTCNHKICTQTLIQTQPTTTKNCTSCRIHLNLSSFYARNYLKLLFGMFLTNIEFFLSLRIKKLYLSSISKNKRKPKTLFPFLQLGTTSLAER